MRFYIILVFVIFNVHEICSQTVVENFQSIEQAEEDISNLNAYRRQHRDRLQQLEEDINNITRYKNDGRDAIDSLSSLITDLQRQVKERSEIYELYFTSQNQASSNIGNQMDALSNILSYAALILTVLLIALGLFVNYQEGKIRSLVEKGEDILKEQKELQKLIDSDFVSVYHKIKAEERNEILQILEKDSSQIRPHYSRMLTVGYDDTYFHRFRSLVFDWMMKKDKVRDLETLFVVMVNSFPKIIAGNRELLPIMLRRWSHTYRGVLDHKFEEFLTAFRDKYLLNEYPQITDHFFRIIEPLGQHHFVLKDFVEQFLFEEIESKSKHFKIMTDLAVHNRQNKMHEAYAHFGLLFSEKYGDDKSNSEEENELIKEYQKLFSEKEEVKKK